MSEKQGEGQSRRATPLWWIAGFGATALFSLFLVFLVLKLTGHIGWTWLDVAAPIWLPASVGVLILACIGFVSIAEKRRND